MDRRLFLWGLSNGATVLALAGAFWIGLGVGMVANLVHWAISAVGTILQVGGGVGLIWAAARLRRRSGFPRSQLRRLEGVALAQKHHIVRGMTWTIAAQTVLIALAVWICVRVRAEHLIWASIGAVVSLHFASLGRLFHVRAYYATAIAGTVICGAGFAVSGTPYGVASLGVAMAVVMWISAAYVLINADRNCGSGLCGGLGGARCHLCHEPTQSLPTVIPEDVNRTGGDLPLDGFVASDRSARSRRTAPRLCRHLQLSAPRRAADPGGPAARQWSRHPPLPGGSQQPGR